MDVSFGNGVVRFLQRLLGIEGGEDGSNFHEDIIESLLWSKQAFGAEMDIMKSSFPCPICLSDSTEYMSGTVRDTDFFGIASYRIAEGAAKQTLPMRRCVKCGHGFVPLGVTQEAVATWYMLAEVDEDFLGETSGRRRTAQVVLDRLTRIVPEKGKLLDVGSGPGLFLDEARKHGFDVSGVEVAAWAVKYARERLGLSGVTQGDVDRLDSLPESSFDVVAAFDVIEHIVAPKQLVEAAARLLRAGGIFVVTTPWFGSPLARLMGRHWYCIFPAHLHYFTRGSLTQLLRESGFEVVGVRRHTRYLGWRYVWDRLLHQLGWGGAGSKRQASEFLLPMNLGDEFEVYARKI